MPELPVLDVKAGLTEPVPGGLGKWWWCQLPGPGGCENDLIIDD